MDDKQKIEVAKQFISLHKSNDEKLLFIYNNLRNGVYGNVEEIDDNEFEVLISPFEHKDGMGYFFSWEETE